MSRPETDPPVPMLPSSPTPPARPSGHSWLRACLLTPEVMLLAIAFWAGIGVVRDFDIWWHLKAGQEILASGTVPRVDAWSHTAAGKPWFAHEWLSEVFFYGLYRAGGLNALLVWKALMGLLTLTLLSRLYRRADSSGGLGQLAGLLAAIVCIHYHLLERPHLFTNLALAVQVTLIETWLRGGRDRLWWLVPAYALWANLHGGVIVGLATFGLYAVGQAVEALAASEPAESARRWAVVRRLALIALVCLFAALLNPRGAELVAYPLKYTGHGTLAADITEWTSPDFREFKPMEALLLALLALGLVSRGGARPTEILLALAGLHLFLQSKRNIVFIALFVLPAAVERLGRLVQGRPVARRFAHPGGGLALLACFVAGVSAHVVGWQPPRVSRDYYPDGAVAFLRDHPRTEPMINEFVYGGYFVWKLFPQYRVFLDSRTDLFFDQDVFAEYLAVFKLAGGWMKVLEKYRVGLAVFEYGHPLATALAATGDWDEIYRDKLSTIWAKRTPWPARAGASPGAKAGSRHGGSARALAANLGRYHSYHRGTEAQRHRVAGSPLGGLAPEPPPRAKFAPGPPDDWWESCSRSQLRAFGRADRASLPLLIAGSRGGLPPWQGSGDSVPGWLLGSIPSREVLR